MQRAIGILQMKKAYRNLPDLKGKDSQNSTIITNNSFIFHKLTQSPSLKRKSTKPIEKINKPFSDKQLQLIRELLKNEEMIIPQINEEIIQSIVNTVTYMKVSKGVVLYSNENKIDNIFYIIEKGKMSYTLDGETCVLRKYDSIGTKALRLNSNNSVLQTVDRTYLFCLPVEKYKNIFQDFIEKDINDKITSLKQCFFFNFLENKIISQLVSFCIKKKYEMRSEIIPEKTQPNCIYLIVEGTVFCVENEVILCKLKENEIFGEILMLGNNPVLYGYIANVETTIIQIPYKEYENILGLDPIKALMFGIFSNSIKKNDYLNKHLVGDRMKPAFKAFQIQFYTEEQVVIEIKRCLFQFLGYFLKMLRIMNLRIKNI